MNADTHLRLMIGDAVVQTALVAAQRDELQDRIARAVAHLLKGSNMLDATQQALSALVGGAAAQDLASPALVTIAGDGAIDITKNSTVLLTKGTAAAITCAAPGAANIGRRITVMAGSNAAHVVTYPGAILGDGTTGLNTTATFAAFIGAAYVMIAISATQWGTESVNVVTCAP